MTPGQRLHRARMLNKMTIKDLNFATGIPVARLYRLEKNARPWPNEIRKLCLALRLSADYWFLGDQVSEAVLLRRIKDLNALQRKAVLFLIDVMLG